MAGPDDPNHAASWRRGIALAILVAIAVWFYSWTSAPFSRPSIAPGYGGEHYNLLVRGFLKGQLSLDREPDPELAAMKNPYDPVERGSYGLHDASYYRGRYYLYFGPTPALTLLGPVFLLTGEYLREDRVVLFFCLAGILFSMALYHSIVGSRQFRGAGRSVYWAGMIAICFATMVPVMLRRPAVWEIPIACGYAFFTLTLLLVWKALGARRAGPWLAVASLAMGLCVGARPVYLFGLVALLAPVLRSAIGAGRKPEREWLGLLACAVVPALVWGIGLGLYNYVRFGSPLEFGQSYQMAGEDATKDTFFSAAYVPFNLWIYLFSRPGLSPYFPFFTVISAPPAPPGQLGVENAYGMLPSIPWVLFALPTVAFSRLARGRPAWWCLGAGTAVLATFAVVLFFGGATNRYMVDFVPGLVLLAAVGACGLAAWRTFRGPLLQVAIWTLLGWSVTVNVFVSMQHNRLLQLNHPDLYAPIAHWFNGVSARVDRLLGKPYGLVELRVVFPTGRTGAVEPLVVTGEQFLSDYLYVHYLADDSVRFGYEHTSRGGAVGDPMPIVPGSEHTITVQMGSLFPPAEHPFFDGLDPDERKSLTGFVQVRLDGRNALTTWMDAYDATDWSPSIGTSGDRVAFKDDFSGRIVSWRRLAAPRPVAMDAPSGPIRLFLKLPETRDGSSEPLLCFGETGNADLIYITYLEDGRVEFGHDRWGYGGSRSAPVSVPRGSSVEIDISCPPLRGGHGGRGLTVMVDGVTAVSADDEFHDTEPSSLRIGLNPVGATTADPEFTGVIERVDRFDALPATVPSGSVGARLGTP